MSDAGQEIDGLLTKYAMAIDLNLDRVGARQALMSAIDALLARTEAAERDAKRYRWMRDESVGQWEHPIAVSQTKFGDAMRYIGPLIGDSLDRAIDAAMEGVSREKEQGHE